MFTGIVEELAQIKSIEKTDTGYRFAIKVSLIIDDLQLGDSVKINSVKSEYFKETYFAERPPNERLINKKLEIMKLNIMRDWKIALREYINDYYSGYLN